MNAALVEEESVKEPTMFDETSLGKEWQKAMEEEIKALEENQT